MNQGLYITAKGMLAQEMRHEIVAQNLANISTTGYQRQTLAFHAALKTELQSSARTLKDPVSTPIYQLDPLVGTDAALTGEIHDTGNPAQLALQGEGYFTVDTPQGPAYTRCGDFALSADGRLTTSTGQNVLGARGPIIITGSPWEVAPDGRVLVQGKEIDRLQLVTISDLSAATRIGANQWQTSQVQPATQVSVRQGALEGSNVSAISEMMTLIHTTRQYEACQKALQAMDGALDRAVNDVGRV